MPAVAIGARLAGRVRARWMPLFLRERRTPSTPRLLKAAVVSSASAPPRAPGRDRGGGGPGPPPPGRGAGGRPAAMRWRLPGGGGRASDDAGGRALGPCVVPTLVDEPLQRAVLLLVDLGRALARRGGGGDVAPPVGLERRAVGDREAFGLDPALVEETRRLQGGRLDDGGPARVQGQTRGHGDVLELAPLRLRGPGRGGTRGQGEDERAEDQDPRHGKNLLGGSASSVPRRERPGTVHHLITPPPRGSGPE